jgi:Fe-S-cluster containining protein
MATARDTDTLPAGDFATWLGDIRSGLRDERDAGVPCAGCTACCRSSQFVHIGPDETDTLAAVPAALRFPAPGWPPGHVVLGYDERGHCPMLVDDGCSIYAVRPRACRTYDCRVFPASGVEADKPAIADRARRWRFTFDARGRQLHAEVVAAASALADGDDPPPNATGLAVRAIRGVH